MMERITEMRTLFIIVLLAVAWGGCSRKKDKPVTEEKKPTPVAEAVESDSQRQEATPDRPGSASFPKPTNKAPEGVWYLKEDVSVTYKDGVRGFKPGQKLTLVREGVYETDGFELGLSGTQVTNNLEEIRSIVQRRREMEQAFLQRYRTPRRPTPTPTEVPISEQPPRRGPL